MSPKYKIKILPSARDDLHKAKIWYNDQRESLGDEFKVEVNKEIDYICENPEAYQLKYKNLRQSLVKRFPYAIFYFIEEKKKSLVILGVLHTSRNPTIIRKRFDKKL